MADVVLGGGQGEVVDLNETTLALEQGRNRQLLPGVFLDESIDGPVELRRDKLETGALASQEAIPVGPLASPPSKCFWQNDRCDVCQ